MKKKIVKEEKTEKQENVQPEVNIGLVGHVDTGKTTLTQALSGKWTDTHSEELKRGITIRLGYADATFYKCDKCHEYTTQKECPNGHKSLQNLRNVSFIDAPGHETLMATMLSGAAIMDGALLLVAANEHCPQPQTREHLMALNLIGINKIVIAQNKIDLVTNEQALENYKQIVSFVKGTIAEHAPIIPISAQHNLNISYLIKAIEDVIKTPERDTSKDPLMYVARSFDINKPGTDIKNMVGGVLGGALKQGLFKKDDKIEIRPGMKVEKEGKERWLPLTTTIQGLKTGGNDATVVGPGGSIGLLTELDPALVKANYLTGNVVGHLGKLPDVHYELNLKPKLLERVVGAKEDLIVEPIKKGEPLLINVNSAATVGMVFSVEKDSVKVKLKQPVCASQQDRVAISRNLGARWRLIGVASIKL